MNAGNEISKLLSAMGANPIIKIKSNKMVEIKINAPTVERDENDENDEKAENAKI